MKTPYLDSYIEESNRLKENSLLSRYGKERLKEYEEIKQALLSREEVENKKNMTVYTREEVEELCREAYEEGMEGTCIKDWLKKML